MGNRLKRLALCGLLLCAGAAADASPIASLSGDVALIPAPTAMDFNGGPDTVPASPVPVLFNEYTNHAIPVFSQTPPERFVGPLSGLSPSNFIGLDFLTLDISGPGTYLPDARISSQLPSTTVVTTYILHFERSAEVGQATASGSVTFNSDIIGIQDQSFNQFARELLFNLPGISLYGSTGLEIGSGIPAIEDMITISPDRRTLGFVLNLDSATDNIRIFLAPMDVPEPGLVHGFAIGLAALAACRLLGRRQPGGLARMTAWPG